MVNVLKIMLYGVLVVLSYELCAKATAEYIRKSVLEINSNENVVINILRKNAKLIELILIWFSVMLLSVLSGNDLIRTIIFATAAELLFLTYKRLREASRKKEVMLDLLNVTECLKVQLTSEISLKTALRNIPKLCKNKQFELKLTDLCLEYELSKFTVYNANKTIAENFNYPEIQIFLSAINQQIQGASALEPFENLTEILKEKEIEFMEEATAKRVGIITGGVALIVINLAALGIYPVFIEIFEGTKSLLS